MINSFLILLLRHFLFYCSENGVNWHQNKKCAFLNLVLSNTATLRCFIIEWKNGRRQKKRRRKGNKFFHQKKFEWILKYNEVIFPIECWKFLVFSSYTFFFSNYFLDVVRTFHYSLTHTSYLIDKHWFHHRKTSIITDSPRNW